LGDEHLLPFLGEVGEQAQRLLRIAGLLVHERADRHLELEVGSAVAGSIRSHPVLAALRGKLGMKPEVDQSIDVRAGDDVHRSAMAAVAAAWAAAGDELLAAERKTPTSAVSGFDVDVDFVNEHLLDREDADDAAVRAVVFEPDPAVDLREDRVVLAEAGVEARAETASALPHDDRAAGHDVAVVGLDGEPLRIRVAAVA